MFFLLSAEALEYCVNLFQISYFNQREISIKNKTLRTLLYSCLNGIFRKLNLANPVTCSMKLLKNLKVTWHFRALQSSLVCHHHIDLGFGIHENGLCN